MPPKSNVPIRIGGSRARSGCQTCKKRHIKCDEGRPECSNCRRGNRQCIFDASQVHPEFRQPTPSDSQRIELMVAGTTQYLNHAAWPSLNSSINPNGAIKSVELSAIQHFANHLGKELAGNFSNIVWCEILPRVAQHEPAVWNGILAVSILDQNLRHDYSGHKNVPNNLAIRHYSKAMQELHIRIENPEETSCKDVVLLCCILFAVFECLQGHYQSALRHISGGMQLLTEWNGADQARGQVSVGNYLDRSTLQSVFLFLDSQAIQLGAVDFRDFFSGPALDDRLQMTHFKTIEDAYLLLNQTFHRISHWDNWNDPVTACGNRPDPEWMRLEAQKLKSQLDEWCTMFEGSVHLDKTQPSSLLLLVQWKVLQILLGKSVEGSSEMYWDNYLPQFKEAVMLAEAYMRLVESSLLESRQSVEVQLARWQASRPALSMAADIILPLFMIGARCRDPDVRRRALRMLRAYGRREGVWDSWLCANMVERVIEIEERDISEDGQVPEHARVCTYDIRLGEEQTAKVSVLVPDKRDLHATETFNQGVAW